MLIKAGLKWGMIGAASGTIGGMSLGMVQRSIESLLLGIILGYIMIMAAVTTLHLIGKKI